MRYLRKVFQIPDPVISSENALEIAKDVCEKNGWRWGLPRVSEGFRAWHIWADRNTKPSAFVIIDHQTGEVERSGCGSR